MKLTLLIATLVFSGLDQEPSYNPLQVFDKVKTIAADFEYGEDRRKVPLRVYLPLANGDSKNSTSPVILFSHGLGGSRNNNPYLGNHWAGRGYAVVFVQHAGSDETVWQNVALSQRLKKLKGAANHENLVNRAKDIVATLNQLEKWNKSGSKLSGRLDLKRIGMSGHSFGAVTTQAVSGQNYGRRGQTFTDSRIKAAIAMSPSVPRFGNNSETFGKVKVPWLLMTGTKDKSIISRTTPEARQKVFQQLPASGHAFELVLHNAEHMAFSERKLMGGQHRNPNHHQAILALSAAFWDAYLKNDNIALQWLTSDAAKSCLEAKDIWRSK